MCARYIDYYRYLRKDKGSTLIEAMTALTLSALVFMMISLLLFRGYAGYVKNTQYADVQENLRIAMDRMSANIRRAQAGTITIPEDKPQITFENCQKGSDGYQFDSNDKEVEEYFNGHWQPVASDITSLAFHYDEQTHMVTIDICGGKKGWAPSEWIVITTKVHVCVQ